MYSISNQIKTNSAVLILKYIKYQLLKHFHLSTFRMDDFHFYQINI